ncbi:MAG TPA: hypothetical protein PK468_12075 [Candidatus Hydrogenedentes bacterium]|nr:hypothetical protein [Candidatus Hydrogenedentota bacterium]
MMNRANAAMIGGRRSFAPRPAPNGPAHRATRRAIDMTTRMLLALIVLALGTDAWGQTSPTGDSPADNTAEEGPLEYGLTERERDAVTTWLSTIGSAASAAYAAEEFQNVDVVPYLIHVLEDPEETLGDRESAMFWLGKTQDSRAVAPLLRLLDALLEEPMLNEADSDLLWATIYAIGFTGHDRAINELFYMLMDDYWAQQGGVPRLDWPSQLEGDEAKAYLRGQACEAIAESGSERAIEAFARGKGIPPEIWHHNTFYLGLAIKRSCGIQRITYQPGEFDDETQARLDKKKEEVERKYGIDLETLDEFWKAAQARALEEAETKTEGGENTTETGTDGRDSGLPDTDAPERTQQ